MDGLIWLLALLLPLTFLQRSLHREIQMVFFLLSRRADISLVLFSCLFFPGVLLHEGSHYVMARLLRVRTGRFSLIPRPVGTGRVQLGYVETAQTDWLRDGLIGGAPLLAGGVVVAYIGLDRLGLMALWGNLLAAGQAGLLNSISAVARQPDFWLWFYLAFSVSSTMMPSASDRRAWLPLVLVAGGLLGFGLMAGAGPWLVENISSPLNLVLRAVAVVFGISALIHMILLLPVFGLRRLLGRLT